MILKYFLVIGKIQIAPDRRRKKCSIFIPKDQLINIINKAKNYRCKF